MIFLNGLSFAKSAWLNLKKKNLTSMVVHGNQKNNKLKWVIRLNVNF